MVFLASWCERAGGHNERERANPGGSTFAVVISAFEQIRFYNKTILYGVLGQLVRTRRRTQRTGTCEPRWLHEQVSSANVVEGVWVTAFRDSPMLHISSPRNNLVRVAELRTLRSGKGGGSTII